MRTIANETSRLGFWIHTSFLTRSFLCSWSLTVIIPPFQHWLAIPHSIFTSMLLPILLGGIPSRLRTAPLSQISMRAFETSIHEGKSFKPCRLNSSCAHVCNPARKLNSLSDLDISVISSLKDEYSFTYCLTVLVFWGASRHPSQTSLCYKVEKWSINSFFND